MTPMFNERELRHRLANRESLERIRLRRVISQHADAMLKEEFGNHPILIVLFCSGTWLVITLCMGTSVVERLALGSLWVPGLLVFPIPAIVRAKLGWRVPVLSWPGSRADCESYLLDDGYFDLLSHILEGRPYVLYLRGQQTEIPIERTEEFDTHTEDGVLYSTTSAAPLWRFDKSLVSASPHPVYGLNNFLEWGDASYRPVYVVDPSEWFAHFLYFAGRAAYVVMNYEGGGQGLEDELDALLSDACLFGKTFVFVRAIHECTTRGRAMLLRFQDVAPERYAHSLEARRLLERWFVGD